MVIQTGQDKYGYYVRWDSTKYYFEPNFESFSKAFNRAVGQMKHAYANGFRGI
jgi:hypothetical protein